VRSLPGLVCLRADLRLRGRKVCRSSRHDLGGTVAGAGLSGFALVSDGEIVKVRPDEVGYDLAGLLPEGRRVSQDIDGLVVSDFPVDSLC